MYRLCYFIVVLSIRFLNEVNNPSVDKEGIAEAVAGNEVSPN